MAAPRVVVTSSSFGKVSAEAYRILREAGFEIVDDMRGPFSGDKLIEVLNRGEAAILGQDAADRRVFENCPNLKAIVKHGAGVDNIDLDAASDHGVIICNVPSMNAEAVAEYTVGLILAAARRIAEADRSMRAGEWGRFMGYQVTGKTIGIVGFGRIGQRVAKKLQGFEPQILAFDPFPNEEAARQQGVRLSTVDEVIEQADVLTLHLPLTAETRGLVSRERLARMKKSAILINTARAGVVDADALADALREGRLAGAAIDVFSEEPVNPDFPLIQMPSVISTPHIAAYSYDAMDAVSILAAHNMVDVMNGRPCAHIVSK